MDAKSIRERCLSYIDEWDSNPEYAILLTGAWGCGKTYFVQNLLKEQNKETPKLAWYISLFGVQNSVDIDARLFEAAHPIIGDVEKQEYFAVAFNVLRELQEQVEQLNKNKIHSDVPCYNGSATKHQQRSNHYGSHPFYHNGGRS